MERKYEALFSPKAEVFNLKPGGCMWPFDLFNRVGRVFSFSKSKFRRLSASFVNKRR